MAYEQRENSGAIFRETDKPNDNYPDYSGTINVEGKMFRIAGWLKTGSSGIKFLSLSVQEPRQAQESSSSNTSGELL